MQKNQQTLKQKIVFSGIGVHSGNFAAITIWPAEQDSGVIFCNAMDPLQKIKVGNVIPEAAMHATVIKQSGWFVSTIEHLVAALSILGVDNAIIEVTGNEIPILDGSAMVFVQGILDVGLAEQCASRRFITPREEISFADQAGRAITIVPACGQTDSLDIEYAAEFNHPLAGSPQLQAVVTSDFFIKHIAPARTWGFLEQLPYLRQHNLARGSSLSNSVVIGQEMIGEIRFPDECIRHKVLDLIGDLSLLGAPLIGKIAACKAGHNFNRLVIEHYIQNPDLWALV